ncbi:MAG: hypothetical protein ACXWP5_12555, partial [Bdellovibrionota bacterium]
LADRLVAHIPYYLMTAFGGLVEPLSSSSLLSRAREQLDITPFPNILPFLMTLAAIALSVQALLRERPKKGGGAEASRRWKAWAWLGAGLLGGALFSTVQFWPMIGYRLIYFSVLPIAFVAIWVMVSSCMGEKIRPLPVILLLVANACTGYYAGSHYSFADVNIDYTRGFVQSVLQRPDVKDCTSERPCCLDIGWWNIARSAESINYDLGISHQPPFHGVNAKMHLGSEAASWPQCVKTIKID